MSKLNIVASCSSFYLLVLALALSYLYTHGHTNIRSLSMQMPESQLMKQAYSLRLAFFMLLLFFISSLRSFSFFSSSLTRSFCSGLVGFMMRQLAELTMV